MSVCLGKEQLELITVILWRPAEGVSSPPVSAGMQGAGRLAAVNHHLLWVNRGSLGGANTLVSFSVWGLHRAQDSPPPLFGEGGCCPVVQPQPGVLPAELMGH